MRLNLTRFLALTCLSAAGLVGCDDVAVQNGEVPEQYLSAAQKYVGDYQGSMDGNAGTLHVGLQGKKVVITFTGSNGGTDIVGQQCGSVIGDVTSVDVDQDGANYVLEGAKVRFNPGNCISIQGQELELKIRERGAQVRISVSLLNDSRMEKRCTIDPGNPSAGIPPREYCDYVQRNTFLKGQFSK